MSSITNFDITSDLRVEFFLPDTSDNAFIIGISTLGSAAVLSSGNLFIINESLLGGENILGGGGAQAFTWQNLSCTVSAALIENGGAIQDQLYFQPEPAAANITLQTYAYDPSVNTSFRPGVPVRIKLVKDSLDQIIWSGVIDSIGGRYTINGQNLLQLVAYDSMKQLLNTRIPEFDSSNAEGYVSPLEQLELIADQFGTSISALSREAQGRIPSQTLTQVIPAELVTEAIQVGLGLFWIDSATQEFVFIPRPDPTILPDFPVGGGYFTLGTSELGGIDVLGSGQIVYTIGNNHSTQYHLCMTDITTLSSSDEVFNSLRVDLKSDTDTFVLQENEDSISLYGTYAKDVTLNTTDVAELDRWSGLVFNQSPTDLVQNIETLTLDRLGNLTEAAFLLPGELIGVDFSQDILSILDYYTITKVSHYLDSNNWLTTLDLWKEA
tara:strand:+ start:1156 stop:2472 length:1317 start_codon:yes stop_codon:yes gene_type:complete